MNIIQSNIKTMGTIYAFLVILMCGFYWSMVCLGVDIGRESKSLEILEQCKTSNTITIKGKEIRCAMVQTVDSIEAARYRSVKNCTKIIKEWEGDGK